MKQKNTKQWQGALDPPARTARAVRVLACILIAALVLSLIPLYGAAIFSYPGVDDYRYGATTHAVWTQTGSLFETVKEAARVAQQTYTSWQGSLSAIFLMALHPGIFGARLYGLSTAILLTVLAVSTVCFTTTLCKIVFKMDGATALCLACLSGICCVQFVPVPVEAYYWFNGGVYYTFYFGLSLLSATLLIRRRVRRTALQWPMLVFLMLLIGTGNLVTGLLGCVLLAGYALWSQGLKKERDAAVWVLLAALLGAFAVNALAPGNGVRQSEHADGAQQAVPAILAAMGDGARYSLRWLAGPAPFVLLAAAPLIWRGVRQSALRFRAPLLVSLGSFLLLSAGFTPNEYALSMPGEARLIDIQFYLFVLLSLINLIWYIGWLSRHWRASARVLRRLGFAAVATGVLLSGGMAVRTRNVAAVTAVRLCVNGSGQAYADVWEERLAILESPAEPAPVLPKFTRQPPLLCMVDIAVDESGEYYWYNEQIAAYYGKRRVLREAE